MANVDRGECRVCRNASLPVTGGVIGQHTDPNPFAWRTCLGSGQASLGQDTEDTGPNPPEAGEACKHCLVPVNGRGWPPSHRLGCPDLALSDEADCRGLTDNAPNPFGGAS